MSRPRHVRRRAFSLTESVVLMVVLGAAVPPTLSALHDAAVHRRAAVQAMRAEAFLEALSETLIADAASTQIGFGGISASDFSDGLTLRLAGIDAYYAGHGLSYQAHVSDLVGPAGVLTGTPQDRYRYVTLTVSWARPNGAGNASLSASLLIADLPPV